MAVVTTETITPEQALAYLDTNLENNRTLNMPRVRQWAKDMAAGRWIPDASFIGFVRDADGNERLADGQHRLFACIEAEVPFRTLVVRDMDPKAMLVIDTGKTRTFGNALKVLGGYGGGETAIARAIRMAWLIENNAVHTNILPTQQELVEWAETHPGIDWATQEAVKVRKVFKAVQQTPLAGVLYFAREATSQEEVDAFIYELSTGLVKDEQHPVYALRRQLENIAGTRTKVVHTEQMTALIIKAWNLRLQGKSVHHLRYNKNEAFPRILGYADVQPVEAAAETTEAAAQGNGDVSTVAKLLGVGLHAKV